MLLLPLVLQLASAATTLHLSVGLSLGVSLQHSEAAGAESEHATARAEHSAEPAVSLEAKLDASVEESLF